MIIGAARSGSTLLAKSIGGHSDCFTLGEINRFNQEIENSETHCGCGELLCECDFWDTIMSDLDLKFGLENKKSNNFEVGIFKQITKATSLYRLIPTILFGSKYKNPSIEIELKNTFSLYNEIFSRTKRQNLIDSTKGLFRALILESVAPSGVEFSFVHILRDGRGVLNSELKSSYKILHKDGSLVEYEGRKNKSHHKAINSWLYVNVRNFVILKLLRNKKTVFVKYEEFTANPVNEMKRIYKHLNIDFEDSALDLDKNENHILGGNASRMNAKKVNKSDEAWKTNLDPKALKAFNLKAGWFSKIMGY